MRKLWNQLLKKKRLSSVQKNDNPAFNVSTDDPLSANLKSNIQVLQSLYSNCSDAVFRQFHIAGQKPAVLIYLQGLSNIELIDQLVLAPLMHSTSPKWNSLTEETLSVSQINPIKTIIDCVKHISLGNTVLLVEGQSEGLSLGLIKWEKRGIEEPSAESVVRGSREGFTETLQVNISLIRRRIRTPKLKITTMTIGSYTNTNLAIAYIEGIIDPTLLEEVMTRIGRIQIDGVLESSYIEEMIIDSPYSPFPQLLNTERPDVVAANLLEGRLAILVDGTPFVLVLPMSYFSLLQSPEDYYQNFMMSTCIRWLRYAATFVAILLPSIYVAVLTFHHEMVPSSLFFSIARSREEIPFPAMVEALIMEVSFEALREAGVKLPKQIGAAVSIVGALVIGQAAVSAGIVSAPMVMVVAVTGIASFMIPHYAAGFSLRILRFPIMFLSTLLGLYGTLLGILFIIVHLCRLRSFGVPYFSPIGPLQWQELKDMAVRAPWWKMNTRPHLTGMYNKHRQDHDQKPNPTNGKE